MSHRNARLNVWGRKLLIERVVGQGRPVAHVAAELGISRQCAHRWVNRHHEHGPEALEDRSSRPHHSPTRTSDAQEAAVLEHRRQKRVGPARIAEATGVPARTVTRILRRHHEPLLWELDPVTGEQIRASRATTKRYEHSAPGDLIHVDVKKLGKIPPGGGWRADPKQSRTNHASGHHRLGYDYVHSAVDDHSRAAYSESLPDEKGETCAGFLLRAAAYFASIGIQEIRRVISDNAFAYRHSKAFQAALASLGAKQKFIKPHCPWQNGKVERFNRTLATEWAYARPFTSNEERAKDLARFLKYYNTERTHQGIGTTPIKRVSPTS